MLSIVVPVYRNKGSLTLLYEECQKMLQASLAGYAYEFVFVDDGSDDGSFEELLSLYERDANISIIKFSKNFGQFSALHAGMHYAKGEYTVCISADLQDPPMLIGEMVQQLETGNFDIVLACRKSRPDGWFKKLTAAFHVGVIRMTAPTYPKGGFDFWMLNRKALDAYKIFADKIRSNQTDILSVGLRHTHLYYNRRKRTIGKSQNNFKRRLNISLNQILSTALWPLRLASIFGMVFLGLSGLLLLRVLYGVFWGVFSLLEVVLFTQFFMGGLILFCMGILGEYVWRIYREAKDRPLYLVDRVFEKRGV